MWPPPGLPRCAPRKEFSPALFSSFDAKMSSSCVKTAAIEASTLVSLAPACHFFFVFFLSFLRAAGSNPASVTTKRMLTGSVILRPPEIAFDWSLTRWKSEISEWKSLRSGCRARLMGKHRQEENSRRVRKRQRMIQSE